MGLNFQYISEYISLNTNKLKDKDNAFMYLYEILSDKESIIDLDYDEFVSIINMLDLSLDLIFQKTKLVKDLDVMKYFEVLLKSQNPENYLKILHSQNDHAWMIKIAASIGRIDAIDYLLNLLPDQETRNKMIHAYNDTPFRSAARNGHTDALKYLVELEKDPIKICKMIHALDERAFRYAAKNGHTETLKYLVSIEQNPESRSKMIHFWDCYAFRHAVKNGHTETIKYLLSLEENLEDRSKMIHSRDEDSFRFAAEQGNTETLKYLVSLEENPEARSKMIHFWDCYAFRYAAKNAHIETLKYLVSLEENIESKNKMIHAWDDNAFQFAAENGHTEILKYLVVYDPFYGWPDVGHKANLIYYKNIDIKSLCKISTLCKSLFSNDGNPAKNNEDDISIIDLPIDILYKILQNLAQVDDEHSSQIKIESVVKAFTYDSSNYSEGFIGFTYRYESALKELGAIDNNIADSE